jgi:hypothetical protein
MPAAHRRAFESYNRQRSREALQRRVATRPTYAVEKHVGKPGGSHEFALAQAIEKHAMIVGAKTGRRKRALQPLFHRRGDRGGAEMA